MGVHTNCEFQTRRDCLRLGLGVLRGPEVDEHDQLVFHLETRIDLLRVPQAMDKQSRARESHQRQPYLHHDQDSTKAVPARAASRCVCAVLQRGHAVHSRSLQRGNQAEENYRNQGETQRVNEDAAIQGEI